MHKKLLITAILIIATTLTQLANAAVTYDFKIDNLAYKILIEGYSVEVARGSSGVDVVIPSEVTHDGYTYLVTQIGSNAFTNTNLQTISIPETITSIEQQAFYGTSIQSVVIPSSVKNFGNEIFNGCKSLTDVKLEDGITTTGKRMFMYCNALKKVSLPNTLISIAEDTFYDCTSLSEIELPNSLIRIEHSAFYNCSSLPNIKFPSRLNFIGAGAFTGCNSFTKIVIPKNIRTLGGTTDDSGGTSFSKCKNLKVVFIEDDDKPLYISGAYTKSASGTTIIREQEFNNCPIDSVYVGRDFTGYRSGSVFLGATTLRSLTIKTFSQYLDLERAGIEKLYLGDGVTGSVNCERCANLTDVFLGNGIKQISTSKFHYCDKLKNIYLFADGVAFTGEEYYLPRSLSKIYCPDPTRIEAPSKYCTVDALATIDPITVEYSGKVPNFTYRNNVPLSDISFETANFNINAGTYNQKIDVKFSSGLWNSTAAIPANYTITKAPLTIVANNITRKYGEPNPELSYTIYGFKNGETVDNLISQPSVFTTADEYSPAGIYSIIVTGGESPNYSLNYAQGNLTILKADQSITWRQDFDGVLVGDKIELTATSSSGLPVSYVVNDESTAEITTQDGVKFIKFLKPGTVIVRALQNGNENYNEAEKISKSITIAVEPTGITLDKSSLSLNINDTYQILASLQPADAAETPILWESSDENIVSVDQNGLITAISKGSATIKASLVDNPSIIATCDVEVLVPVSDITFNITSLELLVGQNENIVATVEPNDASNKQLKWSSSNEKVAFVVDGTVYAIGEGNTTVMAKTTDGSDLQATCLVTVLDSSGVDDVIMDKENVSVYSVDGILIAASIPYHNISDLAPGLYIVISENGVSKKIVIK